MNKLIKLTSVALLMATCCAASSQPGPGYPPDYAQTLAAAKREGKVVVYSVLSNKAAAPLVKDFNALYPDILVEYDGEGGSTETHQRFKDEIAAGQRSADVMWSSAMDLQMQLVQDGYALPYRSPESAKLPPWATYRDQAWGTTFEPVVFVYNKAQVSADEAPQDRASFARLLEAKPEKYKGKVTTFDIEKSGVGFMFAVQDRKHGTDTDRLLAAFRAAEIRRSAGTGTMLTKVASGEYLLGYNIMGAYALVRSKNDLPGLGVVIPKDYTVVLSRVMFISRYGRHPNAAKLWSDYVLSARGQKVIGSALELFAIRDDSEAQYTAAKLAQQLGTRVRPIPLGAEITEYLDPKKHGEFVTAWRAAVDP